MCPVRTFSRAGSTGDWPAPFLVSQLRRGLSESVVREACRGGFQALHSLAAFGGETARRGEPNARGGGVGLQPCLRFGTTVCLRLGSSEALPVTPA